MRGLGFHSLRPLSPSTPLFSFLPWARKELSTLPQGGQRRTAQTQPKIKRNQAKPLPPLPEIAQPKLSLNAGPLTLAAPSRSTAPLPALLEVAISQAQSVSQLLSLSEEQTLLLKHGCQILQRVAELRKEGEGEDSFKEDERYVKLVSLVQRGDYSQNSRLLISTIVSLETLGVGEDVVGVLREELKWSLRRCPVRYLAKAIGIFEVAKDKEIYELAVQTLQRRWVEVVAGADFIPVFKVAKHLDKETLRKLEDRATEMAGAFSTGEIQRIFITLAEERRRPTPLLRTLSYHFTKGGSATGLMVKDYIELLYALNELTFADPLLMEHVLGKLVPEVQNLDSVTNISAIVTSLGQMRYKHQDILTVLDDWVIKHEQSLRPFDLAAWIMGAAVWDFRTENVKKLCALSGKRMKSASTPEWVNFVHSLLVLGGGEGLDKSYFEAALSPEVVKKADEQGLKGEKLRIKLLNINHFAKMNKIIGLSESKVETWKTNDVKPCDEKLMTLLVETLRSILPTDKYLKLGEKLRSGVYVDATCFVNENLDPVPVSDTSGSDSKKYKKVGILVEGYSSLLLGLHKEPSGQAMLRRKLVQLEGFHYIIRIPYHEFSASEKLIRRAKYLEQKLKNLEQLPK